MGFCEIVDFPLYYREKFSEARYGHRLFFPFWKMRFSRRATFTGRVRRIASRAQFEKVWNRRRFSACGL